MQAIDLQRFEALAQIQRKKQEFQQGSSGDFLKELIQNKQKEVFGNAQVKSNDAAKQADSLAKVNGLAKMRGYFSGAPVQASREEVIKSAKRSLGNYIDIMG